MNLNSEQTTEILHTITADKLQGKNLCLFSSLCTGLAQAVNELGQLHTMEQAIFAPSLGLSMLLLSTFKTSLSYLVK